MTREYKDIVVHLDDDDSCAARLDVAVRLATQFAAHLAGIGVERDQHLSNLVGMPTPAFLEDTLRKQETARLSKLRNQFEAAATTQDISAEWRGSEGPPIKALTTHARHSDLIIVGQERSDESDQIAGGLVGAVALAAGVPTLAVPYIGVARPIGKRIVVAWNGGREAIRAVHDALPLLQVAETVEIASIQLAALDAHAHIPGADIALHLARQGVKAQAKVLAPGGMDAANVLLSHVVDSDADMIVMGAYGHSRLRELVLGGVTREILRSMTVPVLLSH